VTLGLDYFTGVYASAADPWGLADRWYEARKYALSLALLPRERYASAFEPGCSVGVLTAMLAGRCDRLLSCDMIAGAVAAARDRTSALPGVRVEQRLIPGDWPRGEFDLIVLSEILYYFGGTDLDRVLGLAIGALRPDGHLLAVHWRHPATDHPRTGDEVHQALAAQHRLARLAGYRDPDFTAEVFTPAGGDPRSVAQACGLV
jgi:SAM-dependent methyltransferase